MKRSPLTDSNRRPAPYHARVSFSARDRLCPRAEPGSWGQSPATPVACLSTMGLLISRAIWSRVCSALAYWAAEFPVAAFRAARRSSLQAR